MGGPVYLGGFIRCCYGRTNGEDTRFRHERRQAAVQSEIADAHIRQRHRAAGAGAIHCGAASHHR
jgi:hypothetical protein